MRKCLKIVSVMLVISLILAAPVSASDEATPWSSAFFTSIDPYIYYEAGNCFEIWFDVVAARQMEELGVSKIKIQVSSDGSDWETIKTCYPEDYPQMICENTVFHADYVEYTGSVGYYYRAYVTFYAKNSTGTGELSAYTQTIRLVAAP